MNNTVEKMSKKKLEELIEDAESMADSAEMEAMEAREEYRRRFKKDYQY